MIIVNKGADYSALGLGKIFTPITEEGKAMADRYANHNTLSEEAVSEFLNTIGSIKNKLKVLLFPILSNNWEEAVINALDGENIVNEDGRGYFSGMQFSSTYKSLAYADGYGSAYSNFVLSEPICDLGFAAIIHSTNFYQTQMGSFYFRKDTYPLDYIKFVGLNYSEKNTTAVKRTIFSDSENHSDIITLTQELQENEKSFWFGNGTSGESAYNYHNGDGLRILAIGKNLTDDEIVTLRAAILKMDSIYFADVAYPTL